MTSSNCVAGAAAAGAGVGPNMLHYVLGITKAYTTRVGGGPFPDRTDRTTIGKHLATRGNEFGATTGRPRRCGWFDAAALKRSIQINGVSGLCVTKLDVLDGVEELKLCTGYKLDGGGKFSDILPVGAEDLARCEPVYEVMPGLEGEHRRRARDRSAARQRTGLSQTHRTGLRRADRHDLHRRGAR